MAWSSLKASIPVTVNRNAKTPLRFERSQDYVRSGSIRMIALCSAETSTYRSLPLATTFTGSFTVAIRSLELYQCNSAGQDWPVSAARLS